MQVNTRHNVDAESEKLLLIFATDKMCFSAVSSLVVPLTLPLPQRAGIQNVVKKT